MSERLLNQMSKAENALEETLQQLDDQELLQFWRQRSKDKANVTLHLLSDCSEQFEGFSQNIKSIIKDGAAENFLNLKVHGSAIDILANSSGIHLLGIYLHADCGLESYFELFDTISSQLSCLFVFHENEILEESKLAQLGIPVIRMIPYPEEIESWRNYIHSLLEHPELIGLMQLLDRGTEFKNFTTLLNRSFSDSSMKSTVTNSELGHMQELNLRSEGDLREDRELQSLKAKLNELHDRFEHHFLRNLKQTLSYPAGIAIKPITTQINQIDDIKIEKKGKQIIYTLPEKIEDECTHQLKEKLSDYVESALEQANEFLVNIKEIVDSSIRQNNLSLDVRLPPLVHQIELENELHRVTSLGNRFSGTGTNRGIMEFFMGARMYYMIFIMSVSMLGPIFSKKSGFILPITIVLVGLGIFQVFRSRAKDKENNRNKQLGSGRDHVKSRIKNTANEFERFWERTILKGLKTRSQKLLSEYEKSLNQVRDKSNSILSQEKKQLRFLSSQIKEKDNFRKKMKTNIDTVLKSQNTLLKDIKMEISRAHQKFMRDYERRD